ncbi:MAG: GYD domain-containing protein [Acidobacteria bacterium]|nr:GYD domain-containing protein [Acidobacteriota bacterium]
MPIFVTLYNFTDQGVRNIKDSPKRLDAAIKAFEAKGGKLLGAYYTAGEYDLIVIAEIEDDQVGLAHTVATVSLGNVRSKTLLAYTPEEFAEIIKKM